MFAGNSPSSKKVTDVKLVTLISISNTRFTRQRADNEEKAGENVSNSFRIRFIAGKHHISHTTRQEKLVIL